jgi:RES domain-containing protein
MSSLRIPLSATVFRAAPRHHRDLRRTAAMSCTRPGRFNTPYVGAVYASCDPATAMAEFEQDAGADELRQCAIFEIYADLRYVVDLTDARCRAEHGITLEDLASDDLSRCQALAAQLIESGVEGVRWPSARGSGDNVAIYFDCLSPRSRADVIAAHAHSAETVSQLRQA